MSSNKERTTSMADYVDLGGVRTWYDERGEGEPLVLLHPGLVDSITNPQATHLTLVLYGAP